jgi:hypothetical protein
MGTPLHIGALTAVERHALALLRQRPQSLHGVAETLGLTLEQTLNILTGCEFYK